MKQISFEENSIQLGKKSIEGILVRLTIENKVRYDCQSIDGISGKKKIPQGFEDSCIAATLVLVNDDNSTAFEKLSQIQKLFVGIDNKANPQVFEVFHRHLEARHIRYVVFDRLISTEMEETDIIEVQLSFTEHNPPIIDFEISQSINPTHQALANLAKQVLENAIKKHPVKADLW